MAGDGHTVGEYIAALSSGDLAGVAARLHDDVVVTIPGRNVNSGVKRGKDEVLQMFGAMLERSGGTMPVEIHDLLESDEHVVALVRRTIAGADTRAAIVYHVRDGKIAEIWSHEGDQYALDEALGS